MVVKRPNVPSNFEGKGISQAEIKARGQALQRIVDKISLDQILSILKRSHELHYLRGVYSDEFFKKESKAISYALARICVNRASTEDIDMLMADFSLSYDEVKDLLPDIINNVQQEPLLKEIYDNANQSKD